VQRIGDIVWSPDTADLATDAFSDVIDHAQLDLPGQERIGDRRSCRTDEIHDARDELLDHGVGRGEPSHADDRLGGQRLETAQAFGV